MQNQEQAQQTAQHADIKGNPQGNLGIGHDPVQGKMKHLAYGKLRFPGITLGCYEMNKSLCVTDVPDEAADETVVFAELLECFQDPLIDEAEVGPAWCDVDRGYGIQYTIIPFRRHALEEARIVRRFPYGLDDVVAFAPFLDQFGNHRRRMLQVTIHGDDGVAKGMIHAAGNGQLMAEVTGQDKSPHVLILLGQAAEDEGRCIFRTVVDKDDFIIHIECRCGFRRLFIEFLNVRLFIVYRNDNRQ